MKIIVIILISLLLLGCDCKKYNCDYATKHVAAYAACESNPGCKMTPEDYRAYAKDKAEMNEDCDNVISPSSDDSAVIK